jgi:Kef-type K+ transport system membrane component KefB
MLAAWASQVHEHGEMLLLLTGSILLCVGVSILLDVSSMIASLAVGATLINLSARTRQLFKSLSRTDPPLYAIFFVIAGADLDITLLGSIGALGLLYVGARALGKVFGARWGSRKLGLSEEMQRWLGLGLMAQAGLAIGLTLIINRQFPEYAAVVTTIVLSSVIVYEIVGPISARFAIMGSGESHAHDDTPIGVLD